MPHVPRYFAQQGFDSAFEPSLKKPKLDYSALCKKNTEEFIPLETHSEESSSPGFPQYYGSDRCEKAKGIEGFQNGFGNKAKSESSRNSSPETHYSRKESRCDYSALCKKNKSEEFIPLETHSEDGSSSSETEHEELKVSEGFLNSFDSEEKPVPSRNSSSEVHYFKRESKHDYSALSKKRTEEFIRVDTHLEEWSSSGFSQTRNYGSDRGNHEKPKVGEGFSDSFDIEVKSGTSKNDSSQVQYSSRRVDINKNLQVLEPPKTDIWKNDNCEPFSLTSTAFIGPLYQPPPQDESRTTHNENRKSPSSFKITTVAPGNATNTTKSKDGMNYELRQFYKELHDLEVASDDLDISQTTADGQQHSSSFQSNIPTVHQIMDLHNQKSLHICQPFPSKQSVPALPSYTNVAPNQSNAPPVHQVMDLHSQKSLRICQPFPSKQSALVLPSFHSNEVLNQSNAPPPVRNVMDTYSQKSSLHDFHPFPSKPSALVPPSYTNLPPNQINARPIHQFMDIHSQKSSLHNCNPFPSKQSALVPPGYHPNVPSNQINAPPVVQVMDLHSQKSSSHNCHPFPSKQSALVFPSYHTNEVPNQSNAPPVHHVMDSYSQKSSLHNCHPFPSKQSALVPPSYHSSETPVSLALPPVSNQGSCHRPAPFDRTEFSFVNQTLPPPGFQGPPPPNFVAQYGAPPPRHNYPLFFPREDNLRNFPDHEKEKYYIVNDDHTGPTTPHPRHNSHVPEHSSNSHDRGSAEPFRRPPFEFSQQTNQQEDFCELRSRHFSNITLPQGSHVPHEQYPPRFREEARCMDFKRKLVLLRGVPGSGKTTLARTLLDQSPDGIIFSTDDYFCQENGYAYDVKLLGDAHSWNQKRARKAIDEGRSPIIIDNTNIQGWEMKPYVQMAIEGGYGVEFREPDTWWKLDPRELEKRNTHRVPREKISQMLERFEYDMNVGVVMNSVEPRHVRSRRLPPEANQRWGASVDSAQHSPSEIR